jgi:hemoglobin-like flavoprotein
MSLDVETLETSFALVARRADELSSRFYERLFERYPAVRPMFEQVDIAEQRKKLVASLALIVGNLRKPDALGEYLATLGRRHGEIGAVPEHYAAVGENLLAVLQEIAGDAWTPEVARAWTGAYGAVQTLMIAGAAAAAPESQRGRMTRDARSPSAERPAAGRQGAARLDATTGMPSTDLDG